jgi:hypothetical protein
MMGERLASRRAVFAALLFAVTPGLSSEAVAAQRLQEGLFKRPPAVGRQFAAPPVARYVSEDGQVFVLDRTAQTRPLLKFEHSPEVWVLVPQPAPRGDTIYKNEMGEPVLRATRLGGVTLFTDERPNGQAVSLVGASTPLRLMLLSAQALGERLLNASTRTGRAAKRTVVFQAEATPASAGLMGDAAIVASLAFVRLSDRAEGRAAISRISKVQLVEGSKPGAMLRDGWLWITVNPAQGLAGRPSSDRIAKTLLGR